MFESGAFFEVADGELDDGVGAVELVRGGGVVFGVGVECVVSPVGPQSLLCESPWDVPIDVKCGL